MKSIPPPSPPVIKYSNWPWRPVSESVAFAPKIREPKNVGLNEIESTSQLNLVSAYRLNFRCFVFFDSNDISLELLLALCKGIGIPESEKFLLVESRILGFGIRNTVQRIQNPSPTNTEDKSSTLNLESTAWNPESKTVLDSTTWAISRSTVHERRLRIWTLVNWMSTLQVYFVSNVSNAIYAFLFAMKLEKITANDKTPA